MRDTLKKQLTEEARTIKTNLSSLKLGMGTEAALRQIDDEFDDADEIKQNQEYYFKQLQNFYDIISEKLVLFDPLDRPTPADNDQAMK